MNNKFYYRRRVLLFSFLFLALKFYGQTIVRNSDYKKFDNVTIVSEDREKSLNQLNLKNFKFNINDKILYENKLVDFVISNDTLFFFDKVKEIEGVEIIKFNGSEKTAKSSRKRASSEIFANCRIASLIQIESKKRTFIKSLTLLINKFQILEKFDGILKVQIVKNLNGLPDDSSELISFEKDIAEITINRKPFTYQKMEFDFPKIIEYPKEGFFVVLYLKTDKKNTISLALNDESPMFMYYPEEGWKKLNFNGYSYKLKVLQ